MSLDYDKIARALGPGVTVVRIGSRIPFGNPAAVAKMLADAKQEAKKTQKDGRAK